MYFYIGSHSNCVGGTRQDATKRQEATSHEEADCQVFYSDSGGIAIQRANNKEMERALIHEEAALK